MLSAVLCLLLAILRLTSAVYTVKSPHRVFEIDYEHDRFLKDGEPFRYVSGSLHYFRIPRPYWRDRLRKCRAAGLNAVCTYIQWSLHETRPGVFDFSGDKDVEHFIQLAQEEGLLVILRPGPYICSERDLGGYPPWLLYENPTMNLRTNDSTHTKHVNSWLRVLLPRIQPYLYGNGGPVIMMQVENEYGSYEACDRSYTLWLRDVFRDYVEDKAVLFTTDGDAKGFLKCGPIPGVFITVDFGAVRNVSQAFTPLREVQMHGPLVNSEFYPGWLTHWGDAGASRVSTKELINSTRQLLLLNASFNFYVFHGGTNFGFSSGANSPPFLPQITSYDFDAPISESGNLTEKYYAIRSLLSEFLPVANISVDNSTTKEYGTITLEPKISLFDSDTGTVYGQFRSPRTFESLQLYSGLMMYETRLPAGYSGRGFLVADNVHDRAIVYVNNEPAGILSRSVSSNSMFIGGKSGQPLALLVENQGHINYQNMSDFKGLIGNVTLNGELLVQWRHTGYPLDNVAHINYLASANSARLPAFYSATFQILDPADTFVDMSGWGKGVLYVNGYNLGRYWPGEGPQVSLYLPGCLLKHNNTVLVLELEREHPQRTVALVSAPRVTGTLRHSARDTGFADKHEQLNSHTVSVQMMDEK